MQDLDRELIQLKQLVFCLVLQEVLELKPNLLGKMQLQLLKLNTCYQNVIRLVK